MTTETMNIHQALVELKTLNKRIESAIREGEYSAISRGNFGAAAAFATVTTLLTAISLMIYLKINKSENIEL